jgi:hypothetical protein
VVKILIFLDLAKTISFLDGHYLPNLNYKKSLFFGKSIRKACLLRQAISMCQVLTGVVASGGGLGMITPPAGINVYVVYAVAKSVIGGVGGLFVI